MSDRDDVKFVMVRGEDWSCYVEWVDSRTNTPVAGSDAKAWMQVRDADGSIIIDFEDGADPEQEPAADVLGDSGVVRLTAPRFSTLALPLGQYRCDLFVERVDTASVVFPNGQRKRILKGTFAVEDRTTEAP